MSTNLAVSTQNLGRVYRAKKREAGSGKEIVALHGVDLEIHQGELFGLLGPNGAGKTTLIKILTTLLAPTSGEARVAGTDVAKNPWEVRRHINMVSGGESSGYGLLTVEENLWLFSQFYGLDWKTARERIREMLKIVGMEDRAKTKIYHLSTGMRQKMNFARGFITDPEIIFLDEPTLGLDVQTSRVLRDFVKNWVRVRKNKTLLLTTHYMQEADELCDRVAIIDRGKILACDTPSNLKRSLNQSSVFHLKVDSLPQPDSQFQGLKGIQSFAHHQHNGLLELSFIVETENALMPILASIERSKGNLISLEKRQPTLEDVFINLVGRGLSEEP
ncbi:ABC transporter ATP-binding protein [Candidatus Acetothermia bacterium]|nr:ABC transporter ATP-binding protein [Candidatus Acetothermia bacterium]MBI3642761.1 ABC transporter ATP-binding protein [Candidatus Acetothermia bacterium]